MTSTPPPSDVPDPLKVLAGLIGAPLKESKSNGRKFDESRPIDRPPELWDGHDFEGQSLQELAKLDISEDSELQVKKRRYSIPSIDECM